MQAAAEGFSTKYIQLQQRIIQLQSQLNDSKEDLASFFNINKEYMKFLRRSINSKNTERDLKDAYKIEFEDLQIEQDKLEEDTASAKQILFDTKKEFLVETKKTTNDKHSGQPLLAEIEHILGKYGIDRAAFHGGDLVGNAC